MRFLTASKFNCKRGPDFFSGLVRLRQPGWQIASGRTLSNSAVSLNGPSANSSVCRVECLNSPSPLDTVAIATKHAFANGEDPRLGQRQRNTIAERGAGIER